ncbi:MAG TPA: class I SAM-dependent methyltransferase [Myxococcota bacterium]
MQPASTEPTLEPASPVCPGHDRYRFVGPRYEQLTKLASGSAIAACRHAAIEDIAPGQRVLVVGAGHGCEAIAAAQAGADVTVVELSATMLRCLRDRAGDTRLRLIHGDALDHHERYDLVVVNFFLNVFGDGDMQRMRRHLVGRVGVGGTIAIGDFIVDGGAVLRFVQTAHWYLALVTFSILAGNALRPWRDHALALVDDGFELDVDRRFSVLGLPLYASQRFRAVRHGDA